MEKNTIILYKAGKFYNAFGDHGLIIHHLVGYKFVEYKQSVGFPESAYNKVINILQKENISYQVYDKSILLEEKKGIAKNYVSVLKEALKNYDLENRLERIKNKINSLSVEELEKVLEVIESDTVK